MTIDLLLVPGGEDENKFRSDTAMIHHHKESKNNKDLKILLTGENLGTKPNEGFSEAEDMRQYLSNYIDDEHLIVSPNGRDFYSGLVFASGLINNMPKKPKNIGLVNDPYTMNRYLQLANFVMGDDFKFETIETPDTGTLLDPIKEKILKQALFYDINHVWENKPVKGSFESHMNALINDHPMYGPNNSTGRKGLYDTIVKLHEKF